MRNHLPCLMPRVCWNYRSWEVKPVLGWQHGLLSLILFKLSSKVSEYFCIMYAIRRVEHLDIPAAQWTRTLVVFRLFSINSKAGWKVCRASWVWQSLRSNMRCLKSSGYLKCKLTPEQTALILFFWSFSTSWAKLYPLIHTYPSPPSASRTFCPSL